MKHETTGERAAQDVSRRDFVALSIAAGIGAACGLGLGAGTSGRRDRRRRSRRRTAPATPLHSSRNRRAPGVLIWPDAFGLRPSMRDIGKRLAAEGYSVLVPNPFYRVAKAPVATTRRLQLPEPGDMAEAPAADGVDQRPPARPRRMPRRSSRCSTPAPGQHGKKIGTQGYCMGGALVVRTAAAVRTASARARRSTAAAW